MAAIAEMQKIKDRPVIGQLINTMQQEIGLLESSLAKKEFFKQRDALIEKYQAGTSDEQAAIDIVWPMMVGGTSNFKKSMEAILLQVERVDDQEKYLAEEQNKATCIENALQQILDDEFEPATEPQYNKEYGFYFCAARQRKGKLS